MGAHSWMSVLSTGIDDCNDRALSLDSSSVSLINASVLVDSPWFRRVNLLGGVFDFRNPNNGVWPSLDNWGKILQRVNSIVLRLYCDACEEVRLECPRDFATYFLNMVLETLKIRFLHGV